MKTDGAINNPSCHRVRWTAIIVELAASIPGPSAFPRRRVRPPPRKIMAACQTRLRINDVAGAIATVTLPTFPR